MQYSSRVIIFPRYFSTNVFIVVVEVFANKTLKNAHCKQNVLHACVQPLPLPSLLSPRFYFNCRLLGRDEPAHVALRGKQAAAKERARSIGHGSEIVSGRLCVPLDRQSNSTDGTRLVD